MIFIKFKNLEKSEMAGQFARDRMKALTIKFPDLKQSRMTLTFEMENSKLKAGLDLFKVKLHCAGGRYDGVTIEKSNSNLYIALADVVEHVLENLNRLGDKARVKSRTSARQILKTKNHFFDPSG